MATITNANVSLAHDKTKKTVESVVRCTVNFTAVELCQMKNCKDGRWFKLKCQLWGADSGLTGADDFLYTYDTVYYFPDATPAASESRSFEVVLGEGVLDEDWGEDEVYGKLILTNLSTLVQVTKKTNTVHHSF
jgi:hypothetical protein